MAVRRGKRSGVIDDCELLWGWLVLSFLETKSSFVYQAGTANDAHIYSFRKTQIEVCDISQVTIVLVLKLSHWIGQAWCHDGMPL